LRLDCQTSGKPCVDALGSRFIRYDRLYVFGEPTNSPSIGLQMGRSVFNVNADGHTFVAPWIYGTFSLAGVYDLAAEQTTAYNPFVYNLAGVGTYGWVEDACNHFNVTSSFTTVPAVDTCNSMNGNKFDGGEVAGYTSWWLSGTKHTKMISSYAVSLGGACVATLYQNGDSNIFRDADLDLYAEVNPTDFFCLESATANFTLRGFHVNTYVNNASNSVFKEAAGITAIETAGLDVKFAEVVPGLMLFNSPSKWTVDGIRAFLPGDMLSNGTTASMYGSVCVKDYSVSANSKCTNYGTTVFKTGADSLFNIQSTTNFNCLSMRDGTCSGTDNYFAAGKTGDGTSIYNSPTGGEHALRINNFDKFVVDTNGATENGFVRVVPTTVAGFGTCNAGAEGTLRPVTDATSATFGALVVGGGTNHVIAYCDGTNLVVH